MNIIFEKVKIQGFQSIGNAEVNLTNQGIVIVKGINNFEGNAKSNGSGKSSIFESIMYAIYGRTSSGITDVENRYTNDGCCVELDFIVDSQPYKIIRSIKHKKYKTGVLLYQGDTDITSKNKTDTEKSIKNDILKMDSDIFLSTIFLSQNFSGKLSALTPSGRKERIETLTDTDILIETFKNKLVKKQDEYQSSMNKAMQEKSYLAGNFDSTQRQIYTIENSIKEAEKDRPKIDLQDCNDKLQGLRDVYNKVRDKLTELSSEISEKTNAINMLNFKNNSLNRDLNQHKADLNKLSESSVCPTCGSCITTDKSSELKQGHIDSISIISKQIDDNNKVLAVATEDVNNLNNFKSSLNEKRAKAESQIRDIENLIKEASKYRDTTADKEKLKDLKASIVDIKNGIDEKTYTITNYELLADAAKNCVSIVTKQFRGHLLEEALNFVNAKLKGYSSKLFSNKTEIVELIADNAKLDIYLGNVLYDTLSGGERKKVDLALVLAQRDLALSIAGFSCNLLVLDETLENLDEVATAHSLSLLMDVSADIESMYIISHNNYSISYDTALVVEKGEDRVSTITYE